MARVWQEIFALDAEWSPIPAERRDEVRDYWRMWLPNPFDYPWGPELAMKLIAALVEVDSIPNSPPELVRIADAARAQLVRDGVLLPESDER